MRLDRWDTMGFSLLLNVCLMSFAAAGISENEQLFLAIKNGDLQQASAAIEQGADVNYKPEPTGDGSKAVCSIPLMQAVATGNADMVKLLVDKGADVNATDGTDTPLISAVKKGDRDMTQVLLLNGADPDVTGDLDQLRTAVNYAAEAGNGPMVDLLLASGVEMDSSVIASAVLGGNSRLVMNLLDRYRDVTLDDALAAAASKGNTALLRLFVSKGADVNYREEEDDMPPLSRAVESGSREAVRFLIQRGADVNAAHYAGDGGPSGVTEQTVLMDAVLKGDAEMVRMLLAAGADPKAEATLHYYSEADQLLSRTVTAVSFAEEKGYTRIAAFLKRRQVASRRK